MEKQYLAESIPSLRITLKKHHTNLASLMFQYISSDRERLSRFLPWPNFIKSVDDEINFINKCNEAWEKHEAAQYGIFLNETQEYLGNIGAFNFNWENESCEIGYWILGKFEGKGYMSEAATALENTLLKNNFNRIVIRFDPQNEKSGSIPKRLNYIEEGTLRSAIKVNNTFRDLKVFSKIQTLTTSSTNPPTETEQIRRLVSELSLAEERQRRSIASDLHDHVGQALTIVKMRLQELQGNNIFSPLYETVGEIKILIEQTIAYTRTLTVELSPPVLYELGFDASMEWLANEIRKKDKKIKVIVRSDKTLKPLTDDLKIAMFRSVSELIQNVIKHANATHIIIEINRVDNKIIVAINDNGKGFDPLKFINGANKTFGLFSIKERLSYLGGTLKIESRDGAGTKVIITAELK